MCVTGFTQVQDMQVASKVTEAANREAFDVDRIKYEEEIASLHRIINCMFCQGF